MAEFIKVAYFLTVVLFIFGLKRMSSPATARSGIVWAGWAMALAVGTTFFWPGLENIALILIATILGVAVAWVSGKRVEMTDMPQMVAIYNGMGGGSAAGIAAVELLDTGLAGSGLVTLSVVGGLIGGLAFSGSMVAFAKLQGIIGGRPITFPAQQLVNLAVFVGAVVMGGVVVADGGTTSIALFFLLTLLFGVLVTLPIGGADMPVVISLFNALTGMAVGFEGFALGNAAMIVAGTVVGAAGTLLTQLMAKAMNRSIVQIVFGAFGKDVEEAGASGVEGSLKPIEPDDAAIMMAYANKIIIVPGYGMAVAQAQHKVRELADLLAERGVEIKYAIHPVAGRMPGHMNVLLAEAGVPYEQLFDLEEINAEFPTADVALVIGANDVVNPRARTEKSSPIYGMPVLNVDEAKNVLVIKRGKGAGFAGIENELFYRDQTRMLYGDAQSMVSELIQQIKQI